MNKTRSWRDPELLAAGLGILGSASGMAITLLPSVRHSELVFALVGAVVSVAVLVLAGYFFERKNRTVFLSFAKHDSSVAQRLAADLKRSGIQVLLAEEELSPGDRISDTLQGSIAKADYLVVLLSPESAASTWVGRELKYALESHRKIFPVLVSDVTSVPDALRDIRYVDLKEYKSGIRSLTDAILRGSRAVPGGMAQEVER
jgi:hypothetical protein